MVGEGGFGLAGETTEYSSQTFAERSLECPTISVVVPVYNGGENFRRCLASLQAALLSSCELIVVVDGSTEDSWTAAFHVGARVVHLRTRCGPAHARNRGAREARGDILLFIDADVTVPADLLLRVLALFARDPELAAVIGSYDDAPGASDFLSQYRNLLHHFVHQNAQEEASTFWGACGAIQREIFFKLGGFDERYREPSVEDIELGYRLKLAGYKIRLEKSLQVKHLKVWQAGALCKTDLLYRAWPWTELILRYRCFLNDLNLRPTSRASVACVYGLIAALLGAIWRPELLLAAGCFMLTLFALNTSVYSFFLAKRGLGFAVCVIPWHWLYYAYSGLGFALGVVGFLFHRHPPQPLLPLISEGHPDTPSLSE